MQVVAEQEREQLLSQLEQCVHALGEAGIELVAKPVPLTMADVPQPTEKLQRSDGPWLEVPGQGD